MMDIGFSNSSNPVARQPEAQKEIYNNLDYSSLALQWAMPTPRMVLNGGLS